MNFSFDFFRNLKKPDVILCNPDRRQIALIETREASLTLRFNDLSELTFEVPLYATNAKGNRTEYEYYSRVEAQRLILVDSIGYFKIIQVNEIEDGLDKYKSVTARSLQIRLNDTGFFVENRLYCFFNPSDPFDDKYDDGNLEQIPSVVGQLNKQLQIQIDPRVIQGLPEIEQDYDEWTISYINPNLRYYPNNDENILRAFTESNTLWGLDFIINNAAELFEVIFEFDFLRQAIKVKTVAEITQRTNIYLSFDNVMNELELNEQADDIVTVMSCNGNNLDIRSVNPTGTNYIADFSYFMADADNPQPKWMSQALSQKIREWQAAVNAASTPWEQLVLRLQNLYKTQAELSADRVYFELKLQDMEAARDRYLLSNTEGLNNLEELDKAKAIFTAEIVKEGEYSREEASLFKSTQFTRDRRHTCYTTPPKFVQQNKISESGEEYWSGRFTFEENIDGNAASFNTNGLMYNDPDAPTVTPVGGYIYFADPIRNDNTSYCKLIIEVAEIENGDPDNPVARWQVSGFERYTIFSDVKKWIATYQGVVSDLVAKIEANNAEIEAVMAQMNEFSSTLNLQKSFDLNDSQERKLFRELKSYWIENEYTNDGLAVFDTTAPEEAINLARELMEEGKKHLSKINQPRFSISVDAIDFTKIHAFKAFASDLGLGKIITIQKSNDTHYYPALTSLSFNLDDTDNFTLVFSNALKPDSQDFLYADLAKQGASMARSVTANWQDITSFNRREKTIEELLYEPLNRTLRAAQSNMSRQEFLIDDTGILGRKLKEESQSSFEDEQIRIINNLILFTNDGWQTAKAALGKIDITHPVYGQMTAYGLLAEALVGSLIIGNTFYISNENNTILLDLDGIKISAPDDPSDVRFHADNDGNVSIKGNIDALTGTIGGLIIQNNSIYSDNGKFSVDANGYLQAVSGKIGGWKIEPNRLVSSNDKTGDGYVGMRSDTDDDIYSFWAGWAPATSQRSFTAFLLTSVEGGDAPLIKEPEPTIAGKYLIEGSVSAVDDENKNVATDYLQTVNQVKALEIKINDDLNEITFSTDGSTATYNFSIVGNKIMLGSCTDSNQWTLGIDLEEAVITLNDTLMSAVFPLNEITKEMVCERCGLSEEFCECEPLCEKCGFIESECTCEPVCEVCEFAESACICAPICEVCEFAESECTCEPVCEVCKFPESECTCEPVCEVCEFPESGCICEPVCEVCEFPESECTCTEPGGTYTKIGPYAKIGPYTKIGPYKKIGPYVAAFIPALPVFIEKITVRVIKFTAKYRQVYVEVIPEYVPYEGQLQIFVATNAPLISTKNFSIEILNTVDSSVYYGNLDVIAGSKQSTHYYTVPVDLNKFSAGDFKLKFSDNGGSTLTFSQIDITGTPTTTEPNFSVKPNGYLVASSGKIGRLSFEGAGLYSSSFKLETVEEGNRLVSNLTFFESPDRPSATFTSNYLQAPVVYTESISGNNLIINASEVNTNTLRVNGTIYASRIEGGGGAYINVNEGATPVAFTASFNHNWWTNEITVSLNRQVLSSVTVTVQYKVVWGNWHTMTYTFSGATTSIKKTGVGAALGYENVSIISNKTFTQTPNGSGVRIQGNLSWNGRQLYVNDADNTVRVY